MKYGGYLGEGVVYFLYLSERVGVGVRLGVLQVSMFILVFVITGAVLWYSKGYMFMYPERKFFYILMCFFSFSMCLLVLSPNIIQFYICWELIGVASSMLVGFWRYRPSSFRSSMLAAVVNRLGDICLGFVTLCCLKSGNLDFPAIVSFTDFQLGLILIAGMVKSALFPFSFWLIAAMEGPTPVSALLHSATLVVAGVYLFLSFSPVASDLSLSQGAGWWHYFMLIIGLFNALYGAMCASFQWDLKKLVAYSTISQLGFAVVSLGLTAEVHGEILCCYYLFLHGIFKASLFMLVGIWAIIIKGQDMRASPKVSSKVSRLLLLYVGLCLMGAPFTPGHGVKLVLFEVCYNSYSFIFWGLMLASSFTSFYCIKLFYWGLRVSSWGEFGRGFMHSAVLVLLSLGVLHYELPLYFLFFDNFCGYSWFVEIVFWCALCFGGFFYNLMRTSKVSVIFKNLFLKGNPLLWLEWFLFLGFLMAKGVLHFEKFLRMFFGLLGSRFKMFFWGKVRLNPISFTIFLVLIFFLFCLLLW
uniref:NADH dehydrogenase subunit 5 n=1 Tax=Polypodium hydriforme TaxID=43186 RepID=UPI002114CE02|nr:NADH dehydrogenase subunit 5 [Polypodium hydriforme]USZ79614.1 NADH dehydrogenase subunit 5 [Polypodium hydriforme]